MVWVQEQQEQQLQTMIRQGLMLSFRSSSNSRTEDFLERCLLLILLEVSEALIQAIKESKQELMELKLIRVFLHLKNVLEP
jgi:hypothetical protein